MRSRSATSLLRGTGLENVYTMEGGLRAWQGMVAHGPPEAGMAFFSPAADAEEIVGLAWALEEGSKLFYQGVAEHFAQDKETRQMFNWLELNFEKYGVKKFVPDEKILRRAYDKIARQKTIEAKIYDLISDLDEIDVKIPDNLEKMIRDKIEGKTTSWDSALYYLAEIQD